MYRYYYIDTHIYIYTNTISTIYDVSPSLLYAPKELLSGYPLTQFFTALFVVISNWAILAIFTAVVGENMITSVEDRRQKQEALESADRTERSVVKLTLGATRGGVECIYIHINIGVFISVIYMSICTNILLFSMYTRYSGYIEVIRASYGECKAPLRLPRCGEITS